MSARSLAATVLFRVCEQGAFASMALDAELEREALEARDAALATEIVYGSLRVLPALDAQLAPRLKQGIEGTDPFTLCALRTALYQLQHLSRVPTYAVVDETVALVRSERGKGVAGFANAVLRALARARPDAPEPPVRMSIPPWLAAQLADSLEPARVEQLLSVAQSPALCLRVCLGQQREVLAQTLQQARPQAQVELAQHSPVGLNLRRAGDPRRLPGHEDGTFVVQEEGAQLAGLSLGTRTGDRVADLCAGHGGKSLLIAEQLGEQGVVTAVDVDERKLRRLKTHAARLGLQGARIQTLPVDLTVGTGGLADDFDRVLVDAPCSGLGTLQRRPELLLRLGEDDPARLAELQLTILRSASGLVKPGGLLAFIVCSPLSVEGPRVAEAFEAAQPEFRRCPPAWLPEGVEGDADNVLRIGPWLEPEGQASLDAYQVIQWRRD